MIFEYAQENLPVIYGRQSSDGSGPYESDGQCHKIYESWGTVKVHFQNREKDILVEVSDTGIGIHEKDLPCVFDAFCRINREGEGSGLGLAIARTIMAAHGGTISVESTPGKGSTFRLTLPKKDSPHG